MKAILNFWDPREEDTIDNPIYVEKGTRLISTVTDFNITNHREYIITKVNSINEITITNDKGNSETYTVEYFKTA